MIECLHIREGAESYTDIYCKKVADGLKQHVTQIFFGKSSVNPLAQHKEPQPNHLASRATLAESRLSDSAEPNQER
jgi:hypothetical protein